MDRLQVKTINCLKGFKAIRKEWEAVYARDTHAQVYLSWFWLYQFFKTTRKKWFVIGIIDQHKSKYVAYLPLMLDTKGIRGILELKGLKCAGGHYSIYQGLFCDPDYENEALETIVEFLETKYDWDRFSLRWVRDRRIKNLIELFSPQEFSVEIVKSHPSLVIHLPDTYEHYLQNYLGRVSRRTLARKERTVSVNSELSIFFSDKLAVGADIDALCSLWNNRWEKPNEMEYHRMILKNYHNQGLLKLGAVKKKDVLIAGLACLNDPVKSTLNAYITSYDPAYAGYSPGVLLFSKMIEYAIENKFRYFDFTVGMDDYKLFFKPTSSETFNYSVKRISQKNKFADRFKKIFE